LYDCARCAGITTANSIVAASCYANGASVFPPVAHEHRRQLSLARCFKSDCGGAGKSRCPKYGRGRKRRIPELEIQVLSLLLRGRGQPVSTNHASCCSKRRRELRAAKGYSSPRLLAAASLMLRGGCEPPTSPKSSEPVDLLTPRYSISITTSPRRPRCRTESRRRFVDREICPSGDTVKGQIEEAEI
jgi:hypothetical protein